MNDSELKRLSRRDLLELLIAQGRERDALQEELEAQRQAYEAQLEETRASLQAQLDEARAALEARRLEMENAGSLAEAALALNDVFAAADNAAQQYLESIRRRSEALDAECAQREAACTAQIEAQLQEAAEAAEALKAQAEARIAAAKAAEAQAQAQAEAYWDKTAQRLIAFYNALGIDADHMGGPS